MNLHEYQAKQLFSQYGVPVPAGQVAATPEAAADAALALGGDAWMVKAQIHAGGRGKAGGVKKAASSAEVHAMAAALLNTRLHTHQTGADGQPVQHVLIECPTAIARELYLSLVVDRATQRVTFLVSCQGGMDIEQVAAATPEAILAVAVHPVAGLMPYQCRNMAFFLGLEGELGKAFATLAQALYRLFLECDASLLEINPLVVSNDHRLLALDGKINLDDNGLYRHPELAQWYDPGQVDAKEDAARAHDLNYITLDGDIACMVNGAGLAMATMDLIKLHGGQPANFLDVGGGATAAKVAEAFKLILSDNKVKAVLVNIFGGIVRCDLIAEGIIEAVRVTGIHLPVIVRLEGTRVEEGRALLASSGLAVIAAADLTDAAHKAVAAAQGG